MSDRDDRRARRANEQQPAIPDGGLNASMPAWLTERPRWADTPPREAPAPVKHLPPPDNSRIELSSILDINDLPAWLQDVARRVERRDAVLASTPVAAPAPEVAPEIADNRRAEVEAQSQAMHQPEPVPATMHVERESIEDVADEPAPVEPVPAVETFAEDEAETPELVTEVAAREASTDVGVDRPASDREEPDGAVPEPESTASPGGLGGQRTAIKGQPVDWAAVRREAAVPNEPESPPASNSLLSQNPPVRVDPMMAVRSRSSRSQSGQDRPWWMSDAAIGVLLVAFILTMIYVILVASEVL